MARIGCSLLSKECQICFGAIVGALVIRMQVLLTCCRGRVVVGSVLVLDVHLSYRWGFTCGR